MAISTINGYTPSSTQAAASSKSAASKENISTTQNAAETNESGVIYEKSDSTSSNSTSTDYKTQNSALIAKLKADTDNRVSQLRGIVEQMMSKQGTAIGNADSMWRFLADGNYTVSAETKAQAQADIASDGYWGVEQTSDRIVDFAKALSGNDSSKADELIDAFKKGFSEATKSWGTTLPEISQKTYDSVLEKFDQWVNGTEA